MSSVQSNTGTGYTYETAVPSSQESGMKENLADKGQAAAEQAKDKAGEAGHEAQQFVRTQVDQRTTQAGEQLGSTADDLRAIAEELRNKEKDGPARLAEQLAERADRVADYLKSSDADQLLRVSGDFARQRPWAVMVGGLFVGFAASRVLKASGASHSPRSGGDDRYELGVSQPSVLTSSPAYEPVPAVVSDPAPTQY